jgi:hypothetical protein
VILLMASDPEKWQNRDMEHLNQPANSFNAIFDATRANVEACERLIGRKLTDGEYTSLYRMVADVRRPR